MRKNKNKSNAYMKASVEMLEQAENAIKSKYSQYDGTEDTMEHVLNEVEKGKDVLMMDAKRKGITEQDMRDAEYSKPNWLEVERYKRHLKRRGLTDEQVRDKKNYDVDECTCGADMNSMKKYNWKKQNSNPWKKNKITYTPNEDLMPILNNSFLCKLLFGDTVIEPYLVRSFHDDVFIKNIHLELFLDSEHIELEERLEEVFTNGECGRLKFSVLEPSGVSIKDTEYSIKNIVSMCEPFYRYDDNRYVVYHLVLEYDAKRGNTNFKNSRSIVNETKYQETSESIKPKEPSFDFGDFSTALEYFEHHLVGDKQYVHNRKFDEVDKDIENKRATIVVCSRSCGITTHMLAHSLAKIVTTPFHKIWYVTPYKQNVNHIFSMNVSDEVRNLKDFEFNRYDGTIKCNSTRSEIRFVSSSQNVENIFRGHILPNEVVYDDMAFMKPEGLNDFINMLDECEKMSGKYVKEICVSTPSKNGSIFNFLAMISPNPIFIPWYENPSRNKYLEVGYKNGKPDECKYTNKWFRDMEEMMGKENAEVEFCCRLGKEEKPSDDKVKKFKLHFWDENDEPFTFEITEDEPTDKMEDSWYELETNGFDCDAEGCHRDDYCYEPSESEDDGWCII
ncbi:MAG: hypothetical protein J6X18_06730 [Bacteroidales bacterium]|nr:hypothetical protein [Bacteroidales bacterium]